MCKPVLSVLTLIEKNYMYNEKNEYNIKKGNIYYNNGRLENSRDFFSTAALLMVAAVDRGKLMWLI